MNLYIELNKVVSVTKRAGTAMRWLLLVLLGVVLGAPVSGGAQTLSLNFPFNNPTTSLTITDSVTAAVVNMTNYSLAPAALVQTNGSGPGYQGQSLDLTADNGAANGNSVTSGTAVAMAADFADPKISLGNVSTFTVAFWFKNGAVFSSGYSPILFQLGAGANAKSAFALNGANTVGFAENTSGNPEFWAGGNTLPNPVTSGSLAANVWYFYALTYNGANYYVYVGNETNGIKCVYTNAVASATLAFGTTGTVIFGARGSDHTRNFPGWLAHFQFYNGYAASQSFLDNVRQQALPLTVGATTFNPLSPVYYGTQVTLSAAVTNGTTPYSYQWQMNPGTGFASLAGATSNNYVLNTTSLGNTTNQFQLIVTDSEATPVSVTNTAAALAVTKTPLPPTVVSNTVITPSPVLLGGTVTMSAVISGTAPVSYQWQYSATNNGTGLVNVAGATSTTLVLTNVQYSNAGYYWLTATNGSGGITTSFAALSVQTPVQISISAAALANPTIGTLNSGTFDIAQLNTSGDAGAPGANKLNYYDNNGAPPGQTFKTGSNPAGYTLGDLYYMCGSPSVNSGSHGVGVTYTLRIYSLTNATAGIATLISTYTNQNTAAAVPNDVWAQWTGLTNVLAPNSVYAYSISASSGWMHLANASNSPAYYNGGLGLFPTSSGTVTFATPTPTTDAVFLLDLVPAGYPDAESVSMSPTNGSTVYAGTPITFDVTAIGANIGYVWQINGTAITSSNTSHLVLDTTPLSPGTYSANVLVTNSYDTNTSAAVSFTVVSAVIQSVALSPTNSSASPVYAGTPITLSASVLGNNLTYYWQTDGGSGGSLMNLPNSNTNNFTFSTAGLSAGTYLFDLMVSNASGTVTSSQLTLYLNAASGPVLVSGATVSPSVVQVGNSTTFTATFTGSLPLYYQWYFLTNNGGTALIAGATSATYTLSTAQFVNAGTYYLQASNYSSALGAQTANSGSAQLYVVSLPQTNTSLATVVDGGTSPLTGNYDVTNLIFNSGLLESKYDPINPYIDSANPVGQIFKTGATPPAGYSGYPLNYVYFKDDPSGSSSGLSSQQGYVLFVYEMLDATNAQLLTSYFTTNTTTMASGDWIYIAGLTNILKLNTTYSVALRKQTTSTFYWKLDGTVGTDPFTDGQQLVAVPALGGTTVFSSPDPTYGYYYNTAFVMGLTPASAPQIVTDTTITPPSVYAGQGPVTMSATFNGKQPIYYHWQFTDANNNTSLIPGATNTTYTIAIANYTNAGTYALLASNSVSSGTNVASTAVTLAVLAPPDSFVINFSKPSFSGPGAIGTGSSWNRITGGDSAAINGASGTIEQSTVSSSTLDDGSTAMPIQFGSFETWEFAHGSGLALLDNYMLLQGQAATSLFPITFSNCIPGVYNVVFYGMDGSYGGGHTVFTVGPVSQTNVNTASSDSSFAPGNNYSVFYNVAVTNGVFTGYWSQVASGTEAAFNGAQLQMAYAAVNPHLFIAVQPADITVPVGFAANLSVTAQGPGTNWLPGQLFYQWWNASTGTAISGATNSIYPISTTAASTSSYYAVITNLTGLATNSAMVTVTIFTPDTLAWRGTVNSTWDFSTLNWSNMTQQADGVAYADTNFVVLDDTAASFVISNSTTLAPGKVVANNSVNNYLILGSGSLTGAMALAKNGNAVLTLSNYNTYTGGTIVNQGTLELATGGASGTIVDNLTINAGGLGRLTVADALGYSGSYVTNINLIGGTLTNASGGNEGYATTFNLTGGTLTSGGGAYNFAGSSSALNSLAAGTVSTILAPVALRANGLVITTAKGTTISGIDLSIQGPVTDSGGSTLTKSGNGTLSLAGTNTFNGDLTVNAGTLRMDGAGRLNSGNFTAQFYNNGTLFNYDSSASQTIGNIISGTGAVTVNGNGTLTLNGVNTYTGLTTVNAGTLAGNGTIAGAVVVNTGGTLAPGASGSGTLTISGNLTLNPGSTNQFAVNGTTPANAAVAAGGTVTYGGVLNLVPSGAFTAGQQFILFSGAGATNTGNFASIQGSAGTGLSFAFTNGVLSVVGTSTPFTGTIQFTGTPVISGTNLTIAATCSGSGTIYLLTSTNLTTAISQWTPIWTNVLTGSGSFTTNLSGVVQPAVPQKFYIFSNTNNY